MKFLNNYTKPITVCLLALFLSFISSNNLLAVGTYQTTTNTQASVAPGGTAGEPAAILVAGAVLMVSVFVAAGAFVAGVVNGTHQAANGASASLQIEGKHYSSTDFSSFDNIN